MPKLSKVEACMICGQVPCECSGKRPVSPRAKKAPESVPADEQTPAQAPVVRAGGKSMRDKMKAAAVQAPPGVPISAKASGGRSTASDRIDTRTEPPQPPSRPDPDMVLNQAIRNLAPLLHEDEKRQYAMLIGSVPTTKERAAFWRAVREAPDGTVEIAGFDPAVASEAATGNR